MAFIFVYLYMYNHLSSFHYYCLTSQIYNFFLYVSVHTSMTKINFPLWICGLSFTYFILHTSYAAVIYSFPLCDQ